LRIHPLIPRARPAARAGAALPYVEILADVTRSGRDFA
jgi:hypothetical protein